MQSKTTAKVGDAPPEWLIRVLQLHQPYQISTVKLPWCVCSWRDRDEAGIPKKYVAFSAEHQAREVHRALSDGVAALFEEVQ
ncbi:hypothetical protein SEA_CHILL_73 [Mycobacterium phage Chill]|uniref:Uncharacterized protein n=3 Tax=Plotvirus plot TaxID=2170099 RepID=A0A2Z4Q0C1_9CAUD|nr:hypothetical protein ERK16_71 [Mycobacterium phage Erk16]QBI97137.1 hypothetical protein SEA_CHILL_73 [Mycobacterium phage Chill]QBP30070.1 hypothetical protein SEA_WALDOWHY_73 [Mycobacterium phage WaldoWhy]